MSGYVSAFVRYTLPLVDLLKSVIYSQEGGDYRGYILCRKRNGLSRIRKTTAHTARVHAHVRHRAQGDGVRLPQQGLSMASSIVGAP